MKVQNNQILVTNQNITDIYQNECSYSFYNFNIKINKQNIDKLVISTNLLFFGEVFDYKNIDFNPIKIIDKLNLLSFDSKINYINSLSGFYIFILIKDNDFVILNDCASQFELFYFNNNNKFLLASQPNLMFNYLDNQEKEFYKDIPKYIIDKKICIFNRTPFMNIHKIIPNHYLEINKNKLERFYPNKKNEIKDIKYIVKNTSEILQNTIKSYSKIKKNAIALTAGWDSRVIFASALLEKEKIDVYVIRHQNESGKIDVEIANQISLEFNINLKIIDPNYNYKIPDQNIKSIWKNDSKNHLSSLMMNDYFNNHYIINGNVSEIARNFFDPLPKKLSEKDLCFIMGLKENNYEINLIKSWMETFANYQNQGYNILDFIYWENKMSNWAASSKSISNLYNNVLSPFNNRILIDLLISSDRKHRDKTYHKLYKDLLNNINPTLNKFKINPTSRNKKIKFLKKIRIYNIYRYVYFKSRKLTF